MKMLNSKKGFFMSARDWISFAVGLFLFIVGIIPLLNKFGVLKLALPAFMTGSLMANLAVWIIAIGGLYLAVDGVIEPAGHMLHTILIVLGFIFAIVGLIPILASFKVIGFNIPGIGNLVVYNTLIVIEGIMLMAGGFTMR